MDSEKLKDFIVPIGLIVLIITAIGYYAPKVYENYNGYISAKTEVQNKQNTIQEKQARLEQYRKKEQEEKNKEKESEKAQKPFYKPVMSGLDTEAVIAGEFTEILQLVRANQIKVRSIKYEYEPSDDTFVAQAGSQYNVARLNMEMIGNYSNYDNFLKEMFKHEHFLDIQSAEIVPYKKNKRVLLINFKVKLYAKK